MSDGWLREGDLHGLQLEKIAKINTKQVFSLKAIFSPAVVLPVNLNVQSYRRLTMRWTQTRSAFLAMGENR